MERERQIHKFSLNLADVVNIVRFILPAKAVKRAEVAHRSTQRNGHLPQRVSELPV